MTLCLYYFFFFKQKTAYEMRISDWSSDVCSSDLHGRAGRDASVAHLHRLQGRGRHGEEADRLPRGRSQGGDALRRRGCRCDAQAVAALQGAAARRGWHADLRDGRSPAGAGDRGDGKRRSEEHTSELQSLMRTSYAVFCLKKKHKHKTTK